jgi:hypothetical protein
VASLEARGACAAEAPAGCELLARARDSWASLGRPLDAARCEFLAGAAFGDRAAMERAGAAYELLGVAHLAERAGRSVSA